MLFTFAFAGLRAHGTTLATLVGGRWRSLRDVLATIALAAVFWIVAHFLLDLLKQGLEALGQSPLAEGRRTSALLGPHGGLEVVLWVLLSMSAGFCEEFVFRGYLQRQFTALTHRPAMGIALSAVIFGIGHAYQGWRSVVVIMIYGAMFGLLAHFSRSLRPGMIAHAWQDVFGGLSGA